MRQAQLSALLIRAIDFSAKLDNNKVDRDAWESFINNMTIDLDAINSSWEELQELMASELQQIAQTKLTTA